MTVKVAFGNGLGIGVTELWFTKGEHTSYITQPCSSMKGPRTEAIAVADRLRDMKYEAILVENNCSIAGLCRDHLEAVLKERGQLPKFLTLFSFVERPTPPAPAIMVHTMEQKELESVK
jgi:hypothetical protein